MVKQRFSDKIILITGAGGGIGAEIARHFTSEGSRVMLVGRRREPLEALVAEITAQEGESPFTSRTCPKAAR
jgi:NADP-dependent 3-hydroxy acid dehydrogenase YdfG